MYMRPSEKFVIIILYFFRHHCHKNDLAAVLSESMLFLLIILHQFFSVRRGIYFTSWLFAFYSLVIYKLEAPVIEIEMWKWLSDCCSLQSVVLSNFVLYGHFSIAFVGVVEHIWRLQLQNFVIFHPSPTTKEVEVKILIWNC